MQCFGFSMREWKSWSTKCFACNFLPLCLLSARRGLDCNQLFNTKLNGMKKFSPVRQLKNELLLIVAHLENREDTTCALFMISTVCRSMPYGFLDGKILHRLQWYSDLCRAQSMWLKTRGHEVPWGEGWENLFNSKLYMKILCTINSIFSAMFNYMVTWRPFCSAVWAMKLCLKRAGLHAQLCHKQNCIAAVMPAPAVSRVGWGEDFSSRRQTDRVWPWERKLHVQESQSAFTCWDCCSGLVSFQKEVSGGKITKVICPVLLELGAEQAMKEKDKTDLFLSIILIIFWV